MFVECPHCKCLIYVEELNCAIFRHGVLKKNLQPIPPHSTKEYCDSLIRNNSIYGCAGPFKVVEDDDGEYIAIVCDYI